MNENDDFEDSNSLGSQRAIPKLEKAFFGLGALSSKGATGQKTYDEFLANSSMYQPSPICGSFT